MYTLATPSQGFISKAPAVKRAALEAAIKHARFSLRIQNCRIDIYPQTTPLYYLYLFNSHYLLLLFFSEAGKQ